MGNRSILGLSAAMGNDRLVFVFLGDIYYADKTGKQVYLNNLLLEKGHAVRVRE